MRARIALFLDVFRLCLRQGWLGNYAGRNLVAPVRRRGGEKAVKDLRNSRRIKGLLLPQGPAAQRLKLVWDGTLPKGWVLLKDRRAKSKEKRAAAIKAKAAKKKIKSKGGQIPNADESDPLVLPSSDPLELPPPSEETPF